LEDLVSDPSILKNLCRFIGIDVAGEYWDRLQRPENVIVPVDLKLNSEQRQQFNELAAHQMNFFGYDISEEEYKVEY